MTSILQTEFTLEQLIAGCTNRNEACMRIFYIRYYGYVLAIALRYLKERSDAQEVVNDSFLKVFANLSKFTATDNVEGSIKSWVSKITVNTAIDLVRKNKKFLLITEIKEESAYSEVIEVVGELSRQDIMRMINTLNEIQRIIFNLYTIEGFSHEEIADTLNISETSSRVYLTRAKKKLRELYKKSLIEANEKSY